MKKEKYVKMLLKLNCLNRYVLFTTYYIIILYYILLYIIFYYYEYGYI